MKKNNLLITLLFVLYGLLPVFDGLVHIFNCEITLISYDYVSLALAAVSVAITALLVMSKEKKAGKFCKVLAAFMPVIHMLNWIAYAYHGRTLAMMIAMAACFVCSVGVSVSYCEKLVLKIVAVVVALALFVPLFIIEPIAEEEEGILYEACYPSDRRYHTEVYVYGDSNENGKTVVKLYDERVDADLGLFTVKSRTRIIYECSYDERIDLEVRWDVFDVLTINGAAYDIG